MAWQQQWHDRSSSDNARGKGQYKRTMGVNPGGGSHLTIEDPWRDRSLGDAAFAAFLCGGHDWWVHKQSGVDSTDSNMYMCGLDFFFFFWRRLDWILLKSKAASRAARARTSKWQDFELKNRKWQDGKATPSLEILDVHVHVQLQSWILDEVGF